MTYTRRDLSALLPALLAAQTSAQRAAGSENVLPSKCYTFPSLPVKTNPANHNETRPVFEGTTHDGILLEVHETRLMPGQMPHPAHHHVNEEMMLIREGTVEMTIAGKSTQLGPGSVAYVHSNEEHGLKNTGDTPAQYFVIAVGNKS